MCLTPEHCDVAVVAVIIFEFALRQQRCHTRFEAQDVSCRGFAFEQPLAVCLCGAAVAVGLRPKSVLPQIYEILCDLN